MNPAQPADAVTLAPAVATVLRGIDDAAFRTRLQTVLGHAAQASTRLRDLDLSRLESLVGSGGGTDLEMWEHAAPAVAASLTDVNGLVAAVHEHFPETAKPSAADDDMDLAFGPSEDTPASAPVIPVTPEERRAAAIKAMQSIAEGLRHEVARFGARVRNPTVVADRWNLLVDLQEFRGRCRAAIGEMVYGAVNAFAEVSRPAVVPEHERDLQEGLAVRHAIVTLTRAVGPLNARLQIASVEQQRGPLLAVQRELELLRGSLGYQWMRASDKRFVIAFVRELEEVFQKKKYGRTAQQLVEGFAKFLDSMAVINRREILMNHDREALAECGMLLEQAGLHQGVGEPEAARQKLAAAVDVARRLFGRDRMIDDHMVVRLRWPVEQLVDKALGVATEELRRAVAEATSHGPQTNSF